MSSRSRSLNLKRLKQSHLHLLQLLALVPLLVLQQGQVDVQQLQFHTGNAQSTAIAISQLTQRSALGAESQINMMEFYGRIKDSEDSVDVIDSSMAYLTLLISYDTLTEKMRFHFNMKEPRHEYFPEIDFQWNDMLEIQYENELRHEERNQFLELSGEHVIYGFSEERLIERKMCETTVLIQERGDIVSIELMARPLNGDDHCLHRDKISLTPLEQEQNQKVIKENDLWFQNLESLESILSTAIFHEDGVEGYWNVNQDDLYASNAHFKDFFMLTGEWDKEDQYADVFFEIKEYDFVGPNDFHDDYQYIVPDRPWFQMQIALESAAGRDMKIKMIFPMDDRHLLINKSKSSFRSQTPKITRVELDGVTKICEDVTIQFEVVYRSDYIRFTINDPNDTCFPFTVEGKWHLELSEEEELEELIENVLANDPSRKNDAEAAEALKDNDMLIESLESEITRLTDEQKEEIRNIGANNQEKVLELKRKRAQRYDTNWVEYDYATKLEEQKDWYSEGHHKRTKEERKARREAREETWELTGALYALIGVAIFASLYYYFCIRRKQLREQPQYQHVIPSKPGLF